MRIFITGASSGIGAELARIYAGRGDELGLAARNADRLEAFAAGLPGQGKHSRYTVDVADRDAVIAAARSFCASGPADLVIANAGISIGVRTEYYEDLEVMERVYRTNVLGMAATFHGFIEPMKKAGRGHLVGIGSVAGIRGLPGSGAYCSSKAAVISYTESLRNELKRYGIRVTTICPGWVRTPLTAKNPYRMPFILDASEFARRAVKAIDSGTGYRTIPWQMMLVSKGLRLVPNCVFDYFVCRMKEKPRAMDL